MFATLVAHANLCSGQQAGAPSEAPISAGFAICILPPLYKVDALIMEHYQLLRKIGRGNFAKVYLALHVPSGKQVSVAACLEYWRLYKSFLCRTE